MRNNIEAERGRLQLTKEKLSNELGISSKAYLSYVRGRPITSTILIKMSHIFGCTVDYLLGLTTEDKPA